MLERLPDTFPVCGYQSHTLAHLHGLPLRFPWNGFVPWETTMGVPSPWDSRLAGDPAFALVRRSGRL